MNAPVNHSPDYRRSRPTACTDSQSPRPLNSEQMNRLGEILDELLLEAEAGAVPDVESACARNPDLASSIRHYMHSIQMLQCAAYEVPVTNDNRESAHTSTSIHRELGDYRLVREIGRGGMVSSMKLSSFRLHVASL